MNMPICFDLTEGHFDETARSQGNQRIFILHHCMVLDRVSFRVSAWRTVSM